LEAGAGQGNCIYQPTHSHAYQLSPENWLGVCGLPSH